MKRKKLYLIHIENQDGKKWHYIGVTTHETLRERLSHHMWGETKSFDALAAKNAKDIGIWRITHAADLGQEKLMQMFDEATVRAFICPRCRAQQAIEQKKAPPDGFDLEEQEEVLS